MPVCVREMQSTCIHSRLIKLVIQCEFPWSNETRAHCTMKWQKHNVVLIKQYNQHKNLHHAFHSIPFICSFFSFDVICNAQRIVALISLWFRWIPVNSHLNDNCNKHLCDALIIIVTVSSLHDLRAHPHHVSSSPDETTIDTKNYNGSCTKL